MNDSSSTSVPLELVLEMHDYDVPCIFQITDGCEHRAKWLISFMHEDATPICSAPPAVPMCEEHKQATDMTFLGFWPAWMGTPPCALCGKRTRLDQCKPVKP